MLKPCVFVINVGLVSLVIAKMEMALAFLACKPKQIFFYSDAH